MMTARNFLMLTSIVLLGLQGCATVSRGEKQNVQASTTPSGATATASDGQSCITPCNLILARDSSYTITFSKTGCASKSVSVSPVIVQGGGLFTGMTGSVYKLAPNPVNANLRCK
jgi:hypothetical protein